MDLSIIIVNYNTRDIVLKCLKTIKQYTKGISYEIILIDNNSSDDSQKEIKKIKDVHLIENDQNVGFARANNQGINKAQGRYVLLLNSDTYLEEDTLSTMVEWMDSHPKVGVSTCKLLNTDKTIQETGGRFPTLMRVFLWSTLLDDVPFVENIFGSYHPHTPTGVTKSSFYSKDQEIDWVKGAFLLMRREVVDHVKGLDEKIFMYGEDVEFCYRVKNAGWKVMYVAGTHIVHIGGASGITENTLLKEYQGLLYFYNKHKSSFEKFLVTLIIKMGALMRIVLFGILGRKDLVKIYAKALAIN